jgi:Zn-dependent protease
MSKSALRLVLACVAGFSAGFAGFVAAFTLVQALGLLEHGPAIAVGIFLIAAFFASTAGAVLFVARRTAHWANPALRAGASGLSLIPPLPLADEGSATGVSDELVRLVQNPPRTSWSPGLLLVASAVLFWLTYAPGDSLVHAGVTLAVLAFHEAGHALGMLIFGYRDVRVFFVPLFGAATSGTRNRGPAWRHGVVLLLGPLPGLLLGLSLALVARLTGSGLLVYVSQTLIFINALNLLPITPLDGGRLFELTLFGRHRVAEFLLQVASTLAFAWLAFKDKNWVLGGLAVLQSAAANAGWSVSGAALACARDGIELPERPEQASPQAVDAVNRRLNARLGEFSPRARATFIRSVVERAALAKANPGFLASSALLLAWAASVFGAFIAIALSAGAEG